MIESSNLIRSMSPRGRKVYFVCICLGLAAVLLAMLKEWRVLHDFSIWTVSRARGTGIRPLWENFELIMTGMGSLLFGIVCMIPAVVLGWRGRKWPLVALALLVFALSAVPILVGQSAFMHIVNARGLVLEE